MKFIKVLRPWQWAKNILILIPALLNKPFSLHNIENAFLGFALFSIFVSGNYILNDISDIENDKAHPKKKFRPIANGSIDIRTAKTYFIILISLSLSSFYYFFDFAVLYLLIYLVFSILYTNFLKFNFIVNSFAISFFFLIRLFLGGFITEIQISFFLSAYIFFTSFFIAVMKKNSILNTKGIENNRYFNIVLKENSVLQISSLSLISLFLSNVALYVWGYDNYRASEQNNIQYLVLFLVVYSIFTFLLHQSSNNGKLEDFVLGVFKDIKLIAISLLLGISFLIYYFV